MASNRVYALVDGKVTHIQCTTKDDVCTCLECGQTLIGNYGEQKDWYFRHKVDSDCIGYTIESLAHKLAKECLKEINKIGLPTEFVNVQFRNRVEQIAYNEAKILPFEQSELKIEAPVSDGLRPDALIDFGNALYCIEFDMFHAKSEKDKKKYSALISETKNKAIYVIEVHLTDLADIADSVELKEKIKERIISGDRTSFLLSPLIVKTEKVVSDATFVCNGDKILCPISNSTIVSKYQCGRCKCLKSTINGVHTCYGKASFCSAKNVRLVAEGKYTCDDIKDMNTELITDGIGEVATIPFAVAGFCPVCGDRLKIEYHSDHNIVSKHNNYIIKGVQTINEETYVVCSCCDYRKEVTCSSCNGHMALLINKSDGRVFIKCKSCDCEGHTRDISDNSDEGVKMRAKTFTVFNKMPVCEENANAEVIAVGGLLNYTTKKKSASRQLAEYRDKFGAK